MSVIRLEGLTKSYGPQRALDDVSVDFPGGAMGLLGPNGAGKTTLLKTLLGLLRADGGRASVLDRDAAGSPLALRTRIGYMPEADCYIPSLSGVRFVAFAGELAGLPARAALLRAHEVLHYVGLGEARYRCADDYSQGMRQRLRLAQAIVHDPELLFLDEPTSGMDPAGRDEMLRLVTDLAESHGKHLLLSTHLLRDVEEVCGWAVVLRDGRVAAEGSLAELTRGVEDAWRARVRGDRDGVARRLEAAGAEVTEVDPDGLRFRLTDGHRALFVAARDAGAEVRELAAETRTLEDVFLRALEGD